MIPRDTGRPELRIGDEEREAAVSALGEHYAAGPAPDAATSAPPSSTSLRATR